MRLRLASSSTIWTNPCSQLICIAVCPNESLAQMSSGFNPRITTTKSQLQLCNARNSSVTKNPWHTGIHTFYDDKKQSKSVVVEDSVSSQQQVLLHEAIKESSKHIIVMLSYKYDSSSAWCLDEHVTITNHSRDKKWSNTSAFSKDHILVSSKRGFGNYEINGMEKAPKWLSWRKRLAEAAEMVELTNLVAKKEVARSLFCCYPDHFSNLQKQKGISWKAATAAAAARTTVKISVHAEFPSSISVGDHYEDMGLHLAFSTRQLQPCTKISSSASKLSFTSNPRACESEDVTILNSGCIEGLHTAHKSCYGLCGLDKTSILNMKTIDQAPSSPPAPTSNLVLANYYADRASFIVLLMTICVVSTFVAAIGFSSSSFKEAHLTGKDATTSRSIIAMNSLVFIVSLVTDMFLLHEFRYKWELQIALFALFGAYICLMKVMIPQAALPMFLLSVPFLFFAAAEDFVDVVK